MSAPQPHRPSFSVARRWGITLSVLISVVAAMAIATMINYLATQYFRRFHLASDPTYRLSPLTVQMLSALTNKVDVVVFFNKREPMFRTVEALLKEYAVQTPKLSIRYVDYLRDVPAAEEAKRTYKMTFDGAANAVLFSANGLTEMVMQSQLSDYDISGLLSGQTNEVRRTTFKGESLFNSAILRVTDPRPRKAYFLQGHREHNPENSELEAGYGQFAGLLTLSNLKWETLRLHSTNEVPADCDLLIIAGPQDLLHPQELDHIDRYLQRGGRLFALLRSRSVTGLEERLAKWNVQVADNLVVDRQNSIVAGSDILVTNFSSHAIVRNLAASGSQIYVILPRSVTKQPHASSAADAARVEELFRSSSGSFTAAHDGQGWVERSKERQPVSLAVAVEKGGVPGIAASRGTTRLVVVGDSLFLHNAGIKFAANYDFGFLAVNWLLDRRELQGGVGPRPVRDYRLVMTRGQQVMVRWILLGGLPGSVLLVGLVVWWRRRH